MVACSICSVLCQKQERSVQLLYVIVVFPIVFSEGFVVDSTRLFHVFACVVFVPFVLVFVEAPVFNWISMNCRSCLFALFVPFVFVLFVFVLDATSSSIFLCQCCALVFLLTKVYFTHPP